MAKRPARDPESKKSRILEYIRSNGGASVPSLYDAGTGVDVIEIERALLSLRNDGLIVWSPERQRWEPTRSVIDVSPMRDPVARALRTLLRTIDGSEPILTQSNGHRVTVDEMIGMLETDHPDAVSFCEDVYGMALRAIRSTIRRKRSPDITVQELPCPSMGVSFQPIGAWSVHGKTVVNGSGTVTIYGDDETLIVSATSRDFIVWETVRGCDVDIALRRGIALLEWYAAISPVVSP